MKLKNKSYDVKTGLFILFFVLCAGFMNFTLAQDAAITSSLSPESDCELTTDEEVGVIILNNSGVFISSGEIDVSYQIDDGAVVQQTLGSNLPGGSTASFTFTQTTDLSDCRTYEVTVWVDLDGDTNPDNDTLRWNVTNDCTIVPGEVEMDMTVCESGNRDTLDWVNSEHGYIDEWVFSTDGGDSWTGTGVTDSSYIFEDLTEETQFKVAINGGYCPNDSSDFALISIQSPPDPGTIDGSDSLCISDVSGDIELSGFESSILEWEYSEDDGISWTTIATTASLISYSDLEETTLYRAVIDGMVCPDVYSDTALIYVEQLTEPGTLLKDTLICEGSSVDLFIENYLGDITHWESTVDNDVWNTISNTQDELNSGELDSNLVFRAILQNGLCSADTTNQIEVDVQSIPNGGSIDSSFTICTNNISGELELTGHTASIIEWQYSEDEGQSWISEENPTATEKYVNLSSTIWYRVLLDGQVCPDIFSDTAFLEIHSPSDGGSIFQDTVICFHDSVTLELLNYEGDIIYWLTSNDSGSSWDSTLTSDSTFFVESNNYTSIHKAIVQNENCAADTSQIAIVARYPVVESTVGDDVTIIEGDTVELEGSGGFVGVWMPGNTLSDSTVTNPLAFPMETTTYTYTVMSTDGCADDASVTVTVNELPPPPPPEISIKNLITANDDGYNDEWIIEGIEEFPNTEVIVFNIYGQKVYQNPNYQNNWRGTFNSKKLPDGTYYYVVKPGGTDEEHKGNLTIIGND